MGVPSSRQGKGKSKKEARSATSKKATGPTPVAMSRLVSAPARPAPQARSLDIVRAKIREMAASDRAVLFNHGWILNGSPADGRRLASALAVLVRESYDTEAAELARTVTSGNLQSHIACLGRKAAQVAHLGQTMSLVIAPRYHALRVEELQVVAAQETPTAVPDR